MLWGVACLGTIKYLASPKLVLFSSILIKKLKNTKMSLTDIDKTLVKAFWGKVSGKADAIGHEALVR